MEKTFMIVDDDYDDRFLFIEAVRSINTECKCVEASNGQEALDNLKSINGLPHGIFLDIYMPQLDGKETLTILKSDATLNTIPVIIYSSSTYPRDINEVKKLGITHFLTKQVTYSDLQYEIKNILQTYFS